MITRSVFLYFFIFSMLIFGSCTKTFHVRPSGNVTKVIVPINDFSGISIGNGIQLIITKDTIEKIIIETDDNVQGLYTSQKIGNNIDIRLNRNTSFRPGQIVKVFISYKNLAELHATSGCVIKLNNPINTTDFKLVVSDGCVLNGTINCTNLDAEISYGSKITLFGKANKYLLNATEGCQINNFAFISNILDCKISHGTTVNLTVDTSIDVVATDGAVLNFKGNATINSKIINSSAQVNKL
jgi:hypothetical protein